MDTLEASRTPKPRWYLEPRAVEPDRGSIGQAGAQAVSEGALRL